MTVRFWRTTDKGHSDTRNKCHFDRREKSFLGHGGEDRASKLECAGIEQRVNDLFQCRIDGI